MVRQAGGSRGGADAARRATRQAPCPGDGRGACQERRGGLASARAAGADHAPIQRRVPRCLPRDCWRRRARVGRRLSTRRRRDSAHDGGRRRSFRHSRPAAAAAARFPARFWRDRAMMKACVMGWPIAHSLSPALHTYWLKAYGIDGDYTRQAVRPEELRAALTRLKTDDWRGCNLTIPHKEAAM